MVEIRYVTNADKTFWYELDKHLPEEEFDKKVRDRQGYVILVDSEPVGILRYNMFWDNVPFCTMLYIREEFQKKGYGIALMEHWQNEMKEKGHGMVLTSTQVDEDAQHFYRRLGYQDCGGLILNIKGYEQPMEMFQAKEI